jgi:hypothetical protein
MFAEEEETDGMSAAFLTWLLKAGEVGDAGSDLAHDGLDLPHDLLVTLLLDRPAVRQQASTIPHEHENTQLGHSRSIWEREDEYQE